MSRLLFAFALCAFLVAPLQTASAQPISSNDAQALLDMCKINLLDYEAQLKTLNDRIAAVENRYRILTDASFSNSIPEGLRQQANEISGRTGKELEELYKLREDLLLLRKYAKKSCDTYEDWVREAKARERSAPTGGGPIAGNPAGDVTPVVREDEERKRKARKLLDDAKRKLDDLERDLDAFDKLKITTVAPPPKSTTGGSWDIGVFGGGVFGGNSPELKPFDQNLDQDGGYQIGTDLIWREDPARDFIVWRLGLEGSYTERYAGRITNQFAPGVLPVRGHDATIAGLIVGGLEIPLGPVRLRADAGAGVGFRDIEINSAGGAPIAVGDGTVFAWRLGAGVIVPVSPRVDLTFMVNHHHFGAVDATTAGGTPFDVDDQTPRVYRVGVGFRY